MSASIRIGTRRSALALWQAEHVAGLLRALDAQLEVEIVKMNTRGDRFLKQPLAAIGGKGLFVEEIESALLRGEVDLAVHSLKDLPAEGAAGLSLAAPPRREDPRDALIAWEAKSLATLRHQARVGTSSLRRAVLIKSVRPDLEIVPIRGNVQTRLNRAIEASGDRLDAVILALAGLNRLGLSDRVTEAFGPDRFVPAVGQGILAIQFRAEDEALGSRLAPLGHAETERAATAERSLLRTLGAGCHVPLGGHATYQEGRLRLSAMVGDPATGQLFRTHKEGAPADAERLGREAAEDLLASEGGRLLRKPAAELSAPES